MKRLNEESTTVSIKRYAEQQNLRKLPLSAESNAQTEISETCAIPPVFERQEVIVTSRPEGSWKSKMGIK